MPDELIDSCSNNHGIFLVDENFEMAFRCENRDYGWDNAGVVGKLGLANFIEAKSTDCIRNSLNDLRNDQISTNKYPNDILHTSIAGSMPVSIA